MGFHNVLFNFRLDDTSIGKIFTGTTPILNGGEISVTEPSTGFPIPTMPDMPNEHAPGLYI